MKRKILFIDDEFAPDFEDALGSYMSFYSLELQEHGFDVTRCSSVDEAITALVSDVFEMAIIDIMMPPGDEFTDQDTNYGMATGTLLARKIKQQYPKLKIIVLSNLTREEGAFADLLKEKVVDSILLKMDTTPSALCAELTSKVE
ncbi:MAG: hypothetical protein JNL67_21750 [Planctomycetaceae bacterium]|nr:hypothetical protein [Planctomycetaceae bacterium]